jgi:cystinosin
MDSNSDITSFLDSAIEILCISLAEISGWAYTLCWGFSYYPQLFKNHSRKSVAGLSLDFMAYSLYGHICYLAFNGALYFHEPFIQFYQQKNQITTPPVQINDLMFSAHSVLSCTLLSLQCIFYDRGKQRVSLSCIMLLLATSILITIGFFKCNSEPPSLDWISFLNLLGMIKVVSSLIKYIPQAYLNYAQKSTHGISITSLILDFSGGVLSFGQVILLCINAGEWTEFVGQIASPKLGLSLVTLLFNSIQLYQHFILYSSDPYQEEVESSEKLDPQETSTSREEPKKMKRVAPRVQYTNYEI